MPNSVKSVYIESVVDSQDTSLDAQFKRLAWDWSCRWYDLVERREVVVEINAVLNDPRLDKLVEAIDWKINRNKGRLDDVGELEDAGE